MKNFLFIYLFITLSIVVNSCEEGYKSENSDGSTLFTLALKEVTAVPYLTTDNTPDYTFSSNIAGSITYGGLCSSSTTVASQGNNKITLDPLSNGTYSDCTITVDTEGPWLIGSLTLSSFIVEDPTSPTITEITAVTTPTNDSTPNYTFSSDQAGTITYGGSCSSTTTSATSGNNSITLNSLNDGTYSDCTIKVTNASGYVSDSITITSFVVDSTAATLAEVTAVTTLTNNSTPEYTFSSDQAGTITYGGSCSSVTTSAINGNTTITLVSLNDGTHSNCTVTVTDTAGNSVTLNMSSFTVDTTAPYVSAFIFSDTELKTGENAVVYLVFSEVVANFSSADDITVDNGNLVAMTSNNNITWQGIFTPSSNTEDASNIFSLATSYTDTAGNTGTVATSPNYMIDDINPSVSSFRLSDTALKAGDNSAVTLVFSEAVASFSSDADITADNGTLATMTSSDNITWTGIFTPTANTEGASNTLSLATSYTDIVGNAGPAVSTANYEVDTRAPSVNSFTLSDIALKAGDNATVTLVFSESVASFSSDADITADNGTLATMTSSDNITWSGTFTPTTGEEEQSNELSLATSYTDTAGNSGPSATTANYEVDTLAPSVSSIVISSATGIQNNFLNAGDNVSVTVTFSEVVNKAGTPQLTLAVGDDNRTATYASGTGNAPLVFTYTIQAGDNDIDGISIRADAIALNSGTIKDAAGNNATLTHNAVSDNASYKVDTTAPTANFSAATDDVGTVTGALTSGDTTDDTALVLSGTNESGSSVKVYNSTTELDNATVSGTSWSYSATVANVTTYEFNVRETDLAGNTSAATSDFTVTVNTTAPTMSSIVISSATGIQNNLLNAGDNVSVTSTFSENVLVTNTPQLTLVVGGDNRTATYTSGSGGTTLVFKYTIQAGETDSNGISIGADAIALNSGTIKDATGNNATLTHSALTDNASYKVDTTAPTANFTKANDDEGTVRGDFTSDNTTDDTALVLSGTNEAESSVMVYDNSTELGAATVSGSSWSYSATVANGTTHQFNVRETDLAGNTSAATSNLAVTGDTTAPTANFTAATDDIGTVQGALTSGDTTDDTAALLLSGTNESGSSVKVYNSTTELDNATVSGTSWSYSATVANGTTYQFNVRETDLAGNTSNATNNFAVTGDTTPPTVSGVAITSVTGIQNNLLNVGDNVSVTVTFSENVPVTGTPQLTLAVGSDNRTATYASGTGNAPLVFTYTIQAGDNDTNGISIRADAIALDNGTISDPAGNNATLTHNAVSDNNSYMVDTEAPRVDNFTLSDTALKIGDNATVTLGFSEVVIEFTAADITNPNGSLPSMISSDNITWTGTFTPTAGEEEPNNTLSLATSYTDLAGNAGPSETTANYAIDTLVPTISSVTAGWGTYLNAAEDDSAGTVTVVTSGAENGQTVTVTLNSTNYTGTVSGNSTAVTVAASGLQALTDGDNYTLTTNVSDAAGNAATVNTGTSFNYDRTPPSISGAVAITGAGIQNNFLNASDPAGGDVVSATVTFSEVVDKTGTPQLTLAVGSDNRTATYASGTGNAPLVFTYTIQAGDNDTNGISIRADAIALNSGSTIMDLAENNAILTHSAVSDNNSYMVDTEAPRVDNFTLSDTALKIGDNATVNLGFSEAVIEFIASDITNPNGSLPSMTSSDNITWTGIFTPATNTEVASNRFSLGSSSYTDLAGNAGPSETTAYYEVETRAPTVSSVEITRGTGMKNNFLNASDPAGGDVLTLSVIFRESVIIDNASGNPTLTLAVGDDNQTATYTSGDNSTTLVFQYTIRAGDTDTNGISIGANALALNNSTIRDTADNYATNLNHDTVTNNSSYKVDTTPPTVNSVAITSGTGILNDFLNHPTDVVSATVTFSENSPVTDTPQLTLAVGEDNHTADYTSSGSGSTTKVFQYTIQAGDNDTDGISIGANALALNNGTISDPAGNNATLTHNAVSSNNRFMVDTEAPRVDNFTIDDALLTIGETATVTLGFSEAVRLFAAANITNPNGSLPSMASSDNINWTGTFTPTTNTEVASNTLSLGINSYTDLAGNYGPAADATPNYEVETLAPSGTFSFTDYLFQSGDTATVTLTFLGAVVGFSSADDITVSPLDNGTTPSGTLAAMTSSDNITWSSTFTPTFPNTQDWTNTLSLATSYTDTVGNPGTAATSPNYMVDDIDPSTNGVPILTLSRSLLLYGQTAELRVVFPEPVASFSSDDDITNPNGSLTSMASSDNITWTGTFTPTTNTEVATNTISLGNSWTDTVGNPGTVATSANYEVETLRPTASSFTFSVTQGTTYNGIPYSGTPGLKPGDNATLTVVFSEPVVSFISADDILNPKVVLDNMTSSDNITWTGTFTPMDETQLSRERFTLSNNSYNDIKGNSGIGKYSLYYVVDTKGPSVLSLQFTDGSTELTSPFTGRCLPVTGNIIVRFDSRYMGPSYITTNTSDTYCAGSIRVSSDNFSSCVRMSSEPTASNSNLNQKFTLNPYENLSYDTTYKVRVTTGAKDVLGNPLSSQYDDSSGYKTSSYPSSSPISGVFVGAGKYGKEVRSIDNGTSWDNETCQILTDLNGVTYGNDTFVAVGASGKIVRSTDNASSWNNSTSGISSHLNGVTFGNNIVSSSTISTFVAVGNSGSIVRSTNNGWNWNNSTSGISSHLNGVTFGNNTFVAVGERGKIVRSTNNGSNWNNANSGLPASSLYNLNGVTFGNNTFVAVGQSGKIVRSTDNGTSFDNSTSGTTRYLNGVTFGNNTFVAVGQSGKIVRSTDNGFTWNNSTSGTSSLLNGVTFGNNAFVAVGSSGVIRRSTDNGSSWNNSTSTITTDINGVTFSE